MQTRLKVDHCILKSFLPLLTCTISKFGALPNTKGIVHKLKDLKWDSKNLIRHFQEARDTLHLVRNLRQRIHSFVQLYINPLYFETTTVCKYLLFGTQNQNAVQSCCRKQFLVHKGDVQSFSKSIFP